MIEKAYIIDDDEVSGFLTSMLLETEGFANRIEHFYSAEEAYNALAAENSDTIPQLILLDLNMPMHSGWDFLEMVKRHEQMLLGRCSIFILSSSMDSAEKARSLDYELVAGFLHKPLLQEDLERIIKITKQSKRL